ncbi:MAG: hypothetical protein WAV78_27145 [Xanthobacteraceae bacterium]
MKGNEGGLVLRPGWINLSVANWSWHKREVPDPHLQYQMTEEKQTQCELACIMENQLSNGELLRQAAAEVLIAVSVIARAMMLKAAVAATKPAEVVESSCEQAECLQAATAVLTEPTQPTANPGK